MYKIGLLKVVCNSGPKIVRYIQSPFKHGRIKIGSIITVAVQKASPIGKVKRKAVLKALVVNTKALFRRIDNTIAKFSQNAVILLKEVNEILIPYGSKINIPLLYEFTKEKRYEKICKMAPEII